MYPRFLNFRSVFIIGFAIGFAFALLLYQSEDGLFSQTVCRKIKRHDYATKEAQKYFELPMYHTMKLDKEVMFQNWIKGDAPINKSIELTYAKWLRRHRLKPKSLDMDYFLYGNTDYQTESKITESYWLKQKIDITCVIFLDKLQTGKAINATWGQSCNRLYFFGNRMKSTSLEIIDVNVKLQSSWQWLCEAINHIWRDAADALEWIIFVKDDTIVIPENLRYMVAPLNHSDDFYLGHTVMMWGQPYNVAQAGYVLSVGAMEKIVNIYNNSEKCLKSGKYWKKEDYYLGKHLTSLGIKPSDTRDQYLRSTFHRYSLPNLLWGAINPDDNWTPIYQKCCSPLTVTFGAGETDKMYTYNYLLYNLQALDIVAGKFGGKAAPTPIPEEDVWKAVLREEFNISYWENITSEKYFEIWSTNDLQVDDGLNKTRYESMPDVLSSVLTAYELQNNSLNN